MRKVSLLLVALLMVAAVKSEEINTKVFSLLNLDYKGLEKVKASLESGDTIMATSELLDYYRNRSSIVLPGFDVNNIAVTADERKWAEESLEHKFFVHRGYQPSYFYGKDIDWTYWPVKDNELRWQLHRHKWFTPLGKMYRTTGDEKYVEAWMSHLLDWIKKNPYPTAKAKRKTIGSVSDGDIKEYEKHDNPSGDVDNHLFSWRPLEASERLNTSPEQFLLFLPAKAFSASFLTEYLCNVHLHGYHILNNFSKSGNHLLFEAQRVLQAGIFFPEFKDAAKWRKSGIDILNKEMSVQVYDDGMQFELDPHYHVAAVNIFFKALQMADANGYRMEFPKVYIDTIEKMIETTINIMFADYSKPIFSDNRKVAKRVMVRYFKDWMTVYPQNEQIRYFATEGKSGKAPEYLSKAFKTSGFYSFRSGWDMSSTAMVLKAGPPAFWHNQPDNGTFELVIKGRNFFVDSGCYVYGGDDEIWKLRNWFRQTMVHKTLTLDNKDIQTTDTKCLLWDISSPNEEVLVIENPSYEGLNHRRSVFFLDKKYFVIVDEAIGTAKGKVGIHFQMTEKNVSTLPNVNKAYTTFEDNNNVAVQTFSTSKTAFETEEGWVSYDYRKREERAAYSVNVNKEDDNTVRFVSVIYPVESNGSTIKLDAKIVKVTSDGMTVDVKIGKEKKRLSYKLN